MQLNNKKTGEVYKLRHSVDGKVTFSVHSRDSDKRVSKSIQIELEGLVDYIYAQSQIKLGSDFEVSNTNSNWIFPERPIRLIIPTSLVTKEMADATPFGVLANSLVSTLSEFTFVNKDNAVVYVSEILPEHQSIVEPFITSKQIIVENK